MRWVEEASAAAEPDAVLAGSLGHLFDERRRTDERKLIASMQRTSNQLPQDLSADVDEIRQLQEKARQLDISRMLSRAWRLLLVGVVGKWHEFVPGFDNWNIR